VKKRSYEGGLSPTLDVLDAFDTGYDIVPLPSEPWVGEVADGERDTMSAVNMGCVRNVKRVGVSSLIGDPERPEELGGVSASARKIENVASWTTKEAHWAVPSLVAGDRDCPFDGAFAVKHNEPLARGKANGHRAQEDGLAAGFAEVDGVELIAR
jgi:hypothetical protein